MKSTSFIYLSAKHYDGTVFETQVADWLKLYKENGIFLTIFIYSSIVNLKRKIGNSSKRMELGQR